MRRSSGACLLPALALALVLASVAREASASVEAIAGWEGDGFGQGYAFLTAGVLARASAATVLPVRLTGSYLYYEFTETAGDVTVQAPGVSLLGGARHSGPSGYLSALVGGEARRERREPEIGGVRVVTRGGFVGQAEAGLVRGRLQSQALAVYSGASKYLYGREVLRWQCSNLSWTGPRTWFLGVEGVGQGNADVDAVQAGGVVECRFTGPKLSLSLRGGGKWASTGGDRRSGGYVGFGLYRDF